MGITGPYLIRDASLQPADKVPELSRRGRAVPVWAVLRTLGRRGTAELVERMCAHARTFAEELGGLPQVRVRNDVVFTHA